MQEDNSYSPEKNVPPTWRPMDAVRKLILDRVADLHTNLSAVSQKVGKNHAYLQQFIKREIPKKLPEELRGKLALVLGVPERSLKLDEPSPPLSHLEPIKEKTHIARPLTLIPGSQLAGERDLPVFGSAQGGTGVLIVSNEAVEWVTASSFLKIQCRRSLNQATSP